MKFFVIGFVLLLTACATTPEFPSAGSGWVYEILGARVKSPIQEGWMLTSENKTQVVFARLGNANLAATAIISTSVFQPGEFESSHAFLEYLRIEKAKNDNEKRFTTLYVNTSFREYKGAECMSYDGMSEDHASESPSKQPFQFFSVVGLVCQHPLYPTIAIQFESSYRSDSKEKPEWLMMTWEKFLSGAEFADS
ncbi:hypothetical protein EZV61_01040 [Corallincola luteus]|uniref:Lipoprotein n=1 Tax=Corallincola luteus TaxID=1775177 RepID=A0ABY2AN21_9GAMM|nr:hypothetical protein [Corallincola luteus]TCI04595.1 hypothetical protein EZV61_01040 [Corallincola luteus]